jgi:hypothetical protein
MNLAAMALFELLSEVFAESVGKCAGLIPIVACTLASMNSKLFDVAGLLVAGGHQALKTDRAA